MEPVIKWVLGSGPDESPSACVGCQGTTRIELVEIAGPSPYKYGWAKQFVIWNGEHRESDINAASVAQVIYADPPKPAEQEAKP